MPGAQGHKTVKGAQSDPNYVSRLLLDCVPAFHKIKSNQIKSNMTLIMVDKPQPSYNLLNVMK